MDHSDVKGLDEDEIVKITLISRDKVSFVVDTSVLALSGYLAGIYEVDSTVQEIVLEHVRANSLAKIIEYLEYHQKVPVAEIPKPIQTCNLKDVVGMWDANFVDCPVDSIFEMLLCANFLHIKPLLELCAAKLATMLVNTTPGQLRKKLNITEEFSPAEEEAIRNEFSFMFDSQKN